MFNIPQSTRHGQKKRTKNNKQTPSILDKMKKQTQTTKYSNKYISMFDKQDNNNKRKQQRIEIRKQTKNSQKQDHEKSRKNNKNEMSLRRSSQNNTKDTNNNTHQYKLFQRRISHQTNNYLKSSQIKEKSIVKDHVKKSGNKKYNSNNQCQKPQEKDLSQRSFINTGEKYEKRRNKTVYGKSDSSKKTSLRNSKNKKTLKKTPRLRRPTLNLQTSKNSTFRNVKYFRPRDLGNNTSKHSVDSNRKRSFGQMKKHSLDLKIKEKFESTFQKVKKSISKKMNKKGKSTRAKRTQEKNKLNMSQRSPRIRLNKTDQSVQEVVSGTLRKYLSGQIGDRRKKNYFQEMPRFKIETAKTLIRKLKQKKQQIQKFKEEASEISNLLSTIFEDSTFSKGFLKKKKMSSKLSDELRQMILESQSQKDRTKSQCSLDHMQLHQSSVDSIQLQCNEKITKDNQNLQRSTRNIKQSLIQTSKIQSVEQARKSLEKYARPKSKNDYFLNRIMGTMEQKKSPQQKVLNQSAIIRQKGSNRIESRRQTVINLKDDLELFRVSEIQKVRKIGSNKLPVKRFKSQQPKQSTIQDKSDLKVMVQKKLAQPQSDNAKQKRSLSIEEGLQDIKSRMLRLMQTYRLHQQPAKLMKKTNL